jgi:hypothetical protein
MNNDKIYISLLVIYMNSVDETVDMFLHNSAQNDQFQHFVLV